MTDAPKITTKASASVTEFPQVHEFIAPYGDPKRRFRAESLYLAWTLEQGCWKLDRAVANGPLILKSGSLSSTITGKIEYGSRYSPPVPGDIQAIVDAQQALLPEVAAATSLTVEVRQLRAERTTPAPVSGAGLDLDASHVRTDPACTFHDGTTPPASRGKRCPACMRLDLDAMARRYSTATDDEVIYEMYPALEAEVRRLAALCIPLTDLAQELDLSRQNLHHSRAMSSAHFERAEREKARAESAEAEVVTLRAKVAAVEAHPVVLELAEERTRQTAKHGDQSHLPDGTGAALWLSMDDDYIRRHGIRRDNLAAWAKARTDEASQASGDGSITFEHILTEEWAEAIAESDPDALRAELVQVAAVAVQWIEAIDLRAALATTGEGERPKCDTCNDTGRCDWSPGEHRDTEEWDRPCIDHCDATTGEGE